MNNGNKINCRVGCGKSESESTNEFCISDRSCAWFGWLVDLMMDLGLEHLEDGVCAHCGRTDSERRANPRGKFYYWGSLNLVKDPLEYYDTPSIPERESMFDFFFCSQCFSEIDKEFLVNPQS